MQLSQLEESIYNCPFINSPECKERLDCHPIPGVGPSNPIFVLLGLNPGARDNIWQGCRSLQELQKQFLRECIYPRKGYGKLIGHLEQLIPLFRISRSVYLTDIVKCPTVNNSPPKDFMIEKCKATYWDLIEGLNPKYVIVLGNKAGKAIGGPNVSGEVKPIQFKGNNSWFIFSPHPSQKSDNEIAAIAYNIAKALRNPISFQTEQMTRQPISVSREVIRRGPSVVGYKTTDSPMSKNLFSEASNLWNSKSANEPPKIGFPTYDFFTKKVQRYVETLVIKSRFPNLKVKTSVGMGKWAQIPWVGIRNIEITTNFEDGVFVVYVFAPEFGNLYLTIIQGVANLTLNEVELSVSKLRKQINKPNGFTIGLEGKLAKSEPLNSKPDKYKRGMLYSKKYSVDALPDEAVTTDLMAALEAYQSYVKIHSTLR